MTLRLLSLCLLICPFAAFAQTNYKEGFIITSKGDTLTGLINYREWYVNPERFEFKTAANSGVTAYTTANARQATINGFETYKSFGVQISMNSISFEKLTEIPDTTTITRTVFLKEIVRGDRCNLYSFEDKIKRRFYVLDNSKAIPEELQYSKTIKNMQEKTSAVYRQQLLQLAISSGAYNAGLEKLIQAADYGNSDLKRIVAQINVTNETTLPASNKRRATGFYVSVGVNNNKVKYSGNNIITVDRLDAGGNDKYKSEITTTHLTPRVAAGVNFYINPAIKRLLIKAEIAAAQVKSSVVSYYKYSSYSSDENENTFNLKAWSLSLIPQVVYNFYNTPDLKVYLGAGFGISYLKASENSLRKKSLNPAYPSDVTQKKYLPLRTLDFAATARAGIQVKQQVEVFIFWSNPTESTELVSGNFHLKNSLPALCAAFNF